MTTKELSQLFYLNREIEQDKQRLAELEAAATSATVKISGLPHIKGIADKTALAVGIADIKDKIKAKHQMCIAEYNRLMQYIASVDDSFIRQVLMLRYINGLTWFQVAAHMGGGNTEDSIKQAHSRFFRKS